MLTWHISGFHVTKHSTLKTLVYWPETDYESSKTGVQYFFLKH